MGQTLFQRLVRGTEPVEFKYFNPANAKIGCSFTLDVLGFRDLIFNLREIWEYKRDGNSPTFGDYVLLARPIGKEDVWVRVRFMPVEATDANLTHQVAILAKYDEMKFCKELDKACRCGSGELEITNNDTGDKENYWRPEVGSARLITPVNSTVSIIKDVNNDGKVEAHEVSKARLEYWDYSRNTPDEAGQQYQQFLFVELDLDTKVQTIWRGEEADPQRVTVL